MSVAPTTHEGEGTDARISTVNTRNQNYYALVWRRFRRSLMGMIGLTLVVLLLVVSVFGEFFAPMDPNAPDIGFAPPDQLSFVTKDGFTLWPVAYPVVEGEELDPITYQPVIGPAFDNPRPLALFVQGTPYRVWGLIPWDRHLIGVADGT